MGSTGVDRGGRGLKRDGALVYGADREVIQWVASIIPGFHINPQSTAIGVIKRGELVAGLGLRAVERRECRNVDRGQAEKRVGR